MLNAGSRFCSSAFSNNYGLLVKKAVRLPVVTKTTTAASASSIRTLLTKPRLIAAPPSLLRKPINPFAITRTKTLVLRRYKSTEAPTEAKGIYGLYKTWADKNPMLSISVATCVIASFGDVLCQFGIEKTEKYDLLRTLRMGGLSLVLTGPTLFTWYGFLYRKFEGRSLAMVMKRLACDQALFAPVFTATFIAALFTVQGNGSHVKKHLEEKYVDTLIVNWGLWIPAQIINFSIIPAAQAVIFANCVAVIWNSYLSWKLHSSVPEDESSEEDQQLALEQASKN